MERSNEGISEELANDFKDSVTAQDDYFATVSMMILSIIAKYSFKKVI